MSTTPITDALIDRLYDDDNGGDEHLLMHWQTVEMNDHARTLETRLARLEEIAEGLYSAAVEDRAALCAPEQDHAAWIRIKQAAQAFDNALVAYRAYK